MLNTVREGTGRLAIEIAGVTKSFPSARGEQLALAAVDLAIPAGQFVCIVGPSGCGKTTLLNMIAGLESSGTGHVRVYGDPVRGPGPDRTVMFQESALFPWLTVEQNVTFPLAVAGISARERADRTERCLRLVHLWRFRGSQPHELSGGMRQRAALARALVVEPKILLMDEPFAALDAQTRDLLHGELERTWLATRTTVVFVTHNVQEAVRLGDRIVVLGTRPGRVRRVLDVKLSRPRDMQHPEVSILTAMVLGDLRAEIEKVIRDEVDDAWEPAARGVRPRPDHDLGRDI